MSIFETLMADSLYGLPSAISGTGSNSSSLLDTIEEYTAPTVRYLSSDTTSTVSDKFLGISNNAWAGAGISIGLAGLSSLVNTWSATKTYNLYKEQEQLYLENANLQAQRIKFAGEAALANLRAEHAITEGKNELSVAAAGAGAVSGSFLDKLMANRSYNTRDERASELSTLYAVDNAKREGYVQAISVAGQALQKAYQTRNDAITNLLKGVSSAVDIIGKDKQTSAYIDAQRYSMNKELDSAYKSKIEKVKIPYPEEAMRNSSAGLIDPEGSNNLKINQEEDSYRSDGFNTWYVF